MAKPKLLIIDDDEGIRTQMKWALADDYDVFVAEDRPAAVKLFYEEKPAVVTLDLGLPPDTDGTEEGFAALGEILEIDPFTKVVIITGREEKEHALQGIDSGAHDFFCKPIDVDDLKIVLKRALNYYRLEHENRELKSQRQGGGIGEMMGTSSAMQKVFSGIRKVADSDVSVLLLGESGTGKELAARAIHGLSQRKKRPFVPINCGAIPDNLLESELFGHEKGAFTGAHARKKGRIESAHTGVLFLDEIGELPLPLQVKLLRFLQDQKLVRIGGNEEVPIDVRVVAATNSDLNESMEKGEFREDLYFRLAVFTINLPPLREREGDVLLLAKVFLEQNAEEAGKKMKGFTPAALKAMEIHSWPGNVRELENRIKRALVVAEGVKLTPQDLDLDSISSKYSGMGLKEAREAVEKDLVEKTLARNKGNISKAAAMLGVSRPTLYELIDKFGIKRR